MRKIVFSLCFFAFAAAAFAISDTGLIPAQKTFAYYLMPSTDFANYSSGIVYNQKLNKTDELEIIYTSFRSPFLLTSNITQLGVHKRYKWGWGGLGLNLYAGVGGIYSPAVGGGLTGDVGGNVQYVLADAASVSLPLYASIFNDGFRMDMIPTVSVLTPFLHGYEVFAGYRFIASMLNGSNNTGTSSSYYVFGLRAGIK